MAKNRIFIFKTLRKKPNGSRYRRLEGRDSPTKRPKLKAKKSLFDGANPAVRVHAVLGRGLKV
jgi:hypothetical protein